MDIAFLFRDPDRPVPVPSLGVLKRPTSLSFIVLRLRTVKDVGRFRTPRDGTVTAFERTETGRSRNKNAISIVI